MPYIHHYPLKVRHYECDAYGRVHDANHLRYMQEAAFDGSAAVGYGVTRYTSEGYYWLAYETDIEFYQPMHYQDDITIKTWIVDFRRVRSLRNYLFYRGDELVAEASTDWVLIDTKTMYPATIPQHMIEAYSQGEHVAPAPPRQQLPQSPIPANAYKMMRRVTWSEIDPAQHVNNAIYLNYVTDCHHQVLEQYGWSVVRLHEMGLNLQTRRYQIEYKLALLPGDEFEVATWLSSTEETQAVRNFAITRCSDGKLATRIRCLWGLVNQATGEKIAFPPQMRDDLGV